MKFGNNFARDLIIFAVHSISSSYFIIEKITILVLGEGPTDGINDRIGAAEKEFSINFSKPKTELCLCLHYSGDESYLYVNKTDICKYKASDNIC